MLKTLTWLDIRTEVMKVNPKLTGIIDNIPSVEKFRLFKIRYPFGFLIIQDGDLVFPNWLNESEVKLIRQTLMYSRIPLGLLINKASEVFMKINGRIIPLNILMPGDLFGVFETLNTILGTDMIPIWSVAAGARSIFMLPKINNQVNHQKLKREFQHVGNVPKHLADQWETFSQIAMSVPHNEHWFTDVLFFTKDWFDEKLETNKAWLYFREYLFRKSWVQSRLLVQRTTLALIRQVFDSTIFKRNLKPRAYLIDTIKHLIAIAKGVAPAFKTSNSEIAAPIKLLQEVYMNVYELKDYIPAIFYPSMLSREDNPVYYSLNYPTILEGYPDQSGNSKLIKDLREIKQLISTLFHYSTHDQMFQKIQADFRDEVDFNYFHSNEDLLGEISPSGQILTIDSSFSNEATLFKDRQPCFNGRFLNGCIALIKK